MAYKIASKVENLELSATDEVDNIVKNLESADETPEMDFAHKEGAINIDLQEQITSAPVVKLLNYIQDVYLNDDVTIA